jgi:hypothetical protein
MRSETAELSQVKQHGVTIHDQTASQGMEASSSPAKHWPVVPTILIVWIAFLIAIAACFPNGIGW